MTKGVSSAALAALLTTTALTGGGAAETLDADAISDRIFVEGRYLSLDKLNAVKTPTPVIDIPQSLSIVDSAQIEAQAFTSIGDITRYIPGISISQGEGHRDAIIIRGNQTTADFFIDGLRDDVQYYRPLYNLEQVEILRGANALLFGRGGGGGVVNRVSKRPVFGEQSVGYLASVDTFGEHYIAGDVNYDLGERAAFRLNAYYTGLNNHRDAFDGEAFAINPTFAFKATADTEVLLSYEYVNDDRVVDRGVPSTPAPNGPDVPLEGFDNAFFGSPDENFTTLQAHILRARIDHTFSEALRGNFTAQYADYDKVYQNLFAAGFRPDPASSGDLVTLDGYRDVTDRENLILQANLVGEFETGPFGHTVLFGAEYGDQDTANARLDNLFDTNGDGLFNNTPVLVNGEPVLDDDRAEFLFTDPLNIPAFSLSDLSRDRESQVRFTSAYLQNQIDVTGWLKLVAGVRYDRFDIEVLDFIEENDGDALGGAFSRVDEEFTPRLGAIVKPMENLSAYFSYSETFLPRSGDQFLVLNLDTQSTRPQFFENTEVGVKWDVRPGLSVTAAVFELERESFTSVDPEDQAELIVIEGAQTRGFELQLTGALTDWWFVSSGYSYLDGEVQRVDGGAPDGNRTRQTPENMFSIWNSFQATDKLSLGLGVAYQDSFFVTEDNAVEVPGFTRLDAAIYYDVSDALRLQVNLENLTDTDYFPDAHSNDNISTGEPINARFTVSGRF